MLGMMGLGCCSGGGDEGRRVRVTGRYWPKAAHGLGTAIGQKRSLATD